MERVLEPVELMDTKEQADAYANADFARVNASFAARFINLFGSHWEGMSILDFGFGTGQVSLAIAARTAGATFVGIEGAQAMIDRWNRVEAKIAAQLDARFEVLHRRIPFVPGEVKFAPHDFLGAGAVISNAFLHHLSDPAEFWYHVRAVSRWDTRVLVVDLLRPDSDAEAHAIVERIAANEHEVLKRDFVASLRAAFAIEEVRQQVRAAGLQRLRVEQLDDHHWGAYGFSATLSKSAAFVGWEV